MIKIFRILKRKLLYTIKIKNKDFLNDSVSQLSIDQFEQIKLKYLNDKRIQYDTGFIKYLDFNKFYGDAKLNAMELGLHTINKKMKILDIGTGPGYFPYVCETEYGHIAHSIDVGYVSLYNDFINLFNLDRKVWEITAKELLPKLPYKFDLITAFGIKFNQKDKKVIWGVEEWLFFIRDLIHNHLNSNGRIYLSLHHNKLYDELLKIIRQKGGRTIGYTIDINDVSGF